MNFDEAIHSHVSWKMKLSDYIRKPDGSLKAAEVGSDCNCALGRWIYGEGGKYSQTPEFLTLKTEHAKFHKCAAEIIKSRDAGKDVSDAVALGASSPYAAASQTVITAIMAMKKKAGA